MPSGDSTSDMALDPGTKDLKPEIQTRDQRAQRKPLESVSVVRLNIHGRSRPLPRQSVTRSGFGIVLLYRQRRDLQAGLGRETWQVEILPDQPRSLRGELIQT